MRVLYVNPEPGEINFARRELSRSAPHVELLPASSIEEAEARLAAGEAYDLVVADLGLVRDNARGDRFANLQQRVPAIAVSGVQGLTAALRLFSADGTADRSPATHGSERNLRSIIDGMSAFIALYAPDGTMLEANQHTLDQWKLTREQMVGRRPWESERWAHSARTQEALRESYERAGRGETIRNDVKARPDGREVITDSTLQPLFDAQGKVTGILSFGVDVTERHRALAALERSETRLNEAQRVARLGSWELDLVSNSLMWSDEIFRIFEIDKERFGASYEAFLDAIHPDDREEVDRAYTQSVQTKEPYEIVHRLLMADGRVKYVRENCETYYDAAGNPLRSLGTVQDITERREAQEALRVGEERFRAVFDLSPNAMVLTSLDDSLVVAANSSVEGAEEAIGRPVGEIKWWLSPSDRDEYIEALVKHGRVDGFEATIVRRNGKHMDALLSGRLITIGDKRHTLTSVVDITDRKQSEERLHESEAWFRAVFEQSPAPMVLTTFPGGLFVDTNTAFSNDFGYSREELVGRTSLEFGLWARPEDRDRYFDGMRTQGRVVGMEVAMLKKGGEEITLLVSAGLLRLGGATYVLISGMNITERERAEQRYQRVVEHISDALIIDDLDGRVVFANERFFELFHMKGGASASIQIEDYVAPEWRAELVDRHHRRMRGEDVPAHFEYEGLRPDGKRIWVEVDVTHVVEAGRHIGTQSTMRDISSRKLMERVMGLLSTGVTHMTGEAFFGEIAKKVAELAGADIGFVGQLVATPEPSMRTLGMSDGGAPMPLPIYKLAGSPCERVIEGGACVFADHAQELFPAFPGLAEAGIQGYAAVPLLDTAGRPIGDVGIMSRVPIEQPEEVVSILRVVAARTAAEIEHQRSEVKFVNLFQYSPDGILMVDAGGRIAEANPQAEVLFGYSRDELLGMTVHTLVPEARREGHIALVRDFMNAPDTRGMGTGRADLLEARKRDGTVFPVEISLSPIYVDDSVVVVATVRDISQRVQADLDRQLLEAQLRQSQKMEAIGTLAGGIAHDFNNILAAIIGNTEIAAMDLGRHHPAMETLDEVRKASNRAKDLVSQILAFSRQQDQPRAACELRPVIEEVVHLLRAGLPASVELVTTFGKDVRPVLADPTQIHQVLMNLCTNAWHALDGKPGRIGIDLDTITVEHSTRRRPDLRPGHYSRITVRDTGKGMDAATRERIFEPFFTTKGVGEGTGLGLAVVHGIVKGHGGTISVTSQPGAGTAFEVLLPAIDGAAPAAAREQSLLPHGNGQHILYIDDERSLVLLMERMIEGLGYRVTGFTSATDALAALRTDAAAFDLVFTDMNMPGTSGLDLMRELLRVRPELPVVLTSGLVTDELRASAEALGCGEILNKPATLVEIAEALQRSLSVG